MLVDVVWRENRAPPILPDPCLKIIDATEADIRLDLPVLDRVAIDLEVIGSSADNSGPY